LSIALGILRKLIRIFAVLTIATSLLYLWKVYFVNFGAIEEFKNQINEFSLEEVQKEILAPPPLRGSVQTQKSFLTRSGVISETNNQRINNGLFVLRENESLNLASQKKLQDMFSNQYFAHVSPSGAGPSFWIESVGYEYVTVGENLALGNFSDDFDLVLAWMNSPGHRANILHERFQEIGVAVGRGVFEGRETWLAVQMFGLPLSVCPKPDESLKISIEANQVQIDQLFINLESKREELENTRPKRGSVYEQKVEEYNQLVVFYNDLIRQTKLLIERYNRQVKSFNACVEG